MTPWFTKTPGENSTTSTVDRESYIFHFYRCCFIYLSSLQQIVCAACEAAPKGNAGMTYATEHLAGTLKNARRAKGLSQRALGKMAAIPQGHVSKIEAGAVDLRVSSLVELARALDLELMLVPRKTVPAVQSIVRGDAARPAYSLEDDDG